MKKIILKLGILFLTMLTLSPTLTTVSAEGIKNLKDPKAEDESSVTFNVINNTTVEIDNNRLEEIGYNQFIVEEHGTKYEQEFFIESNIVRIDSDYFDLEEYILALDNDTYSITEALNSLKPLYLEKVPTQEEHTITNQLNENNIRETYSRTLPRTGYGPLRYAGNRRKTNMLITATAAAGAALKAYLFPGAAVASGIAFAKTVISKAITAGLISHGTQAITSNVYYNIYQATHKKTYGAVKEKRVPYTQIQNKKIYGSSYTWYFWSTRPY